MTSLPCGRLMHIAPRKVYAKLKVKRNGYGHYTDGLRTIADMYAAIRDIIIIIIIINELSVSSNDY